MKTVLYSLYIISLNRFLLNILIITQKPTNSSKKISHALQRMVIRNSKLEKVLKKESGISRVMEIIFNQENPVGRVQEGYMYKYFQV